MYYYLLVSFFSFLMLLVALSLFFVFGPGSAEVSEGLISPLVPVATRVPVVEEVVAPVVAESSVWTYTMLAGGAILLVGAGIYFGLPFIYPLFGLQSVTREQVEYAIEHDLNWWDILNCVIPEIGASVDPSLGSDSVFDAVSVTDPTVSISSVSSTVSETAAEVARITSDAAVQWTDIASWHPGFFVPVALLAYFATHPVVEQVASSVSAAVSQKSSVSAAPSVGTSSSGQCREGALLYKVVISFSTEDRVTAGARARQNLDLTDSRGVVGTFPQLMLLCLLQQEMFSDVARLLSWEEIFILNKAYLRSAGILNMSYESFIEEYPQYPGILRRLQSAGLGS